MIGAADPWVHWMWLAGFLVSASGLSLTFWMMFGKEWNEGRKATAKKLDKVCDLLLGEPANFDNIDPSPGLIEQVNLLRADVEAVRYEVTPNGGDSNRLGDRVKRLEEFVTRQFPDG